jgi:hypothetical protein
MGMTNGARDIVVPAITGTAISTPWNNANSYIGVGDSATSFAVTQTDLQAASNKLRKVQDATFPTTATPVLTFRSTFATTDANFAWQEWAVFNSAAGVTNNMLNRFVQSLGTKTSAQSWQLTATLTFSVS